jgi:hypothetical protein
MPPPSSSNKRKSDVEDDPSSRPKKMSKAEKAAVKERARQAMQASAAVAAVAPVVIPAAASRMAATAAPTTKKEAMAQAKERAKLAMMTTTMKAPPAMMMTTMTMKPPPEEKGKSSKSPPRRSRAATTKKKVVPKTTEKEEEEMTLPPTSLRRTQSTPLELELEQQVLANSVAAQEGKPLPFTSAPPDHLLKFAPTELEEGYDHNDDNAKDINDDDDDDEAGGDDTKDGMEEDDNWNAITSAVIATPARPLLGDHLLFHLWTCFLLVLVGITWLYGGGMLAFSHKAFHHVMARFPLLPRNPYRTPIAGKPIPYKPCFLTNVDHPPVPVRPECLVVMTEYNSTCPKGGVCWGGDLQQCTESLYLEVSPSQTACQMKHPVQQIFNHVMQKVASWTLDHQCQEEMGDSYHDATTVSSSSSSDSPQPHLMIATTRTPTYTKKQPMFLLDYILDLNPFLLASAVQQKNRSPVESLFRLIQTGNKVLGFPFYTKTLSHSIPVDDEGERTIVEHSYLVAVDPAQQYINKLFPRRTQCRYRMAVAWYTHWRETPAWLLLVAMSTMVAMILGWIRWTRHWQAAAEAQRELLQRVETTRMAVLQVLETTAPKLWRSVELMSHLTTTTPSTTTTTEESTNSPVPVLVRDKLFEERIWPRVVFDIRGHPQVQTSVIVSNGDLVDVWQWRSTQEKNTVPAASAT